MDIFNTREVATAIWIAIFISWALTQRNIRKSVFSAIRSAFSIKIVVPVFLMALYTAVIIYYLFRLNIWNISLLKDTILWFCFSAITMMASFVISKESVNILRKVAVDTLKVIIVLEFLVNTYTFHICVELLLIPSLTFIAILGVFAGTEEKYSAVEKITDNLQIIFGLVILGIVVGHAIADLQNLSSMDTLRSIALVPVLSLLLTPYIYVLLLYSNYEQVFIRLNTGREKDKAITRYARRKILLYAGIRLHRCFSSAGTGLCPNKLR